MFYNTHIHTAAMVSKSKYDFHRMFMIWICMLKKWLFTTTWGITIKVYKTLPKFLHKI